LGGAIRARSPRLDLLLERERQAALFLSYDPTTSLQYRLIEAIAKINHYSKVALGSRKRPQTATRRGAQGAEPKPGTRPRRVGGEPSLTEELSAGRDSNLQGMTELLRAVTTLTTLDDRRQAF